MSWQGIIVGIVVLLCLIEVVRRVLRFFRSTAKNNDPCAGCPNECELKRMLDAKKQTCGMDRKGKKHKKGCG